MTTAARLTRARAHLETLALVLPPRPGAHGHPSLDALYACIGGTSGPGLSLHVLSPEDAPDATSCIADKPGWQKTRAIAHDHGGNFAALFLEGELDGMVGVYDHDDERARPAFASIVTFVEALAESPESDLVTLATELPRRRVADDDEEEARERAIFARRRAAFAVSRSFDDAWIALAFAPADDPTALAIFLDAASAPWIRETACEISARLHGDGAIATLERFALEGPRPNGPIVGISSLRRLDTPAARDALARLRPLLPEYGAYFPRRRPA